MISRNVKRLLTSILDGTPKRGAFCTSTLDGTPKRGAFYTSTLDGTPKRGAFYTSTLDGIPKRGAFCTSTLDGTPKRGAFCTSTLDGTPKGGLFYTSILDGRLKRDAFLCTRVGAYCIRPTFLTIKINGTQIRSTKHPCKETEMAKGDQTHDSLSPMGPFSGAYAIRPYYATPKCDAFLCTRVGAYCIRPTKRSRKGTRSAKGGQTCDFLSPTGPFGGAYAIRPYHATSKRDAFYTSYLVATLKRGAFCTSTLDGTPKHGAFGTSTLDGRLKRDAFCLFYSSFLALMQEKKQKKIKASAEAGEVGRVHLRNGRDPGQIFRVHHWRGRNLSRVCLLFFRLLFLAYSFSYVSVLYFRSEGVHSDVP